MTSRKADVSFAVRKVTSNFNALKDAAAVAVETEEGPESRDQDQTEEDQDQEAGGLDQETSETTGITGTTKGILETEEDRAEGRHHHQGEDHLQAEVGVRNKYEIKEEIKRD